MGLRLKLLIVAAVSLLFVSAAVERAAARTEIGYVTVSSGMGAAWVAQDAGFFAKNGLEARVIYIPSTTLTQAMLAGQVPLGVIGASSLVEANVRGADFAVLGSFTRFSPVNSLVTRKDITNVEQLRGKKVGVSRIGAASHRILEMALQKLGLDPRKDVAVLQVGNSPLRVAALKAGNIDGTVLSVEEAFHAQKSGLNVLYDLRKLGVEYLSSDFVTTRKFIRENESAVRNFVKAIVEGIHYFKSRKEESIRIMSRHMRTTDTEIIEVGYTWHAEEYQAKPYVSPRGLQSVLDHLSTVNPKVKEMRPEQIVEARFVRELDQSGFIDGLYKK